MKPFLVENPPRMFEPSEPTSEDQFELQVIRVAGLLMPNFNVARWKPRIRDWHGHGARPDLAMISHDLENWYVIEVELASHSVSRHIRPQLETLRNGVYDRTLVPSLRKSFPSVDEDQLTRLVARDPGLLCIVDQYTEMIWRVCKATGFEMAVLEPYHENLGSWAVFVERLPSELSRSSTPTTFSLSRGHRLGDSIVMELPQQFPASYYKIRLPITSEITEHRFVQVQKFNRRPGIVLSLDLVPESASAKVEIIDPTSNLAELVVDN